jgi:hypothetical protein
MSEIRVDTISEKTSANGVAVDGVTLKDGQVDLADNKKILIGDSDDLEIYHDGSHSYISDQGTGDLRILAANSFVVKKADASENIITANADGAVGLSYDASQKLATTATGIEINGGFTATDGSTITVADNSDTLTLKSTDTDATAGPILKLSRDNNSASASDVVGKIIFTAEDGGNNLTDYAEFLTQITDASDGSESVRFIIKGMKGGNYRKLIDFNTTETIFNDESDDLDFRVESNDNTHMLFVDGGNNRVGIGTTPDLGVGLHIRTGDSSGSVEASKDELVIENSANAGITILSGASSQGAIAFGDSGDNDVGRITYAHSDNSLRFHTNASEVFRIDNAGNAGIGEASPDTRLHVTETIDVAYSADNFTIDANALLKLENPSTTGAAFSAIQFRTGSGADLFFGGVQGSGNEGAFIFGRQGSPDLELVNIAHNGATTITTADNTDTLSLISTDADASAGPILRLTRDSSSPANDDVLGQIFFTGEDAGGNATNYASIRAIIADTTDGSEDGQLFINRIVAGTDRRMITMTGTATVFNEDSVDIDFRVESNNNSGMFFVNAGSDHVSVGTDGDLGGVFNVSGETVMRTSGNSDTLTLKCTDADAEEGPILRLTRDSSSPANNDVLGRMFFTGEDAGSNATNYVQLTSQASNVAEGSETANFQFEIFNSGSLVEFQKFQGGTGTVFNEGSNDLDFRVESNGNTHMLFVDGNNDHVNMGTSTAYAGKLNIETDDNSFNLFLVSTDADANAGPNMKFYRNSGSPADNDIMGNIHFTGRNDNSQDVDYAHIETLATDVSDGAEDGYMNIYVAHAGTKARSRIEMDSTEMVINEGGVDLDFRVESDGNDNMFFVDGGNDHVNIGGSSDAGGLLNVFGKAVFKASDNSDNIELLTTDADGSVGPNLKMYRNSSSPADNDDIGIINFVGENDAGEEVNYAQIKSIIKDVTDGTEDGKLELFHVLNGALTPSFQITPTEIVLNEYNGFTGTHWSRLSDNSKPTILRGTIMDSIDEMCDWYQAVAEVAESTDDEGNVTPAHTVKESIALGDKSVGDAITFTSNGTEYSGTIVKEDDVKHTKCKVSDTADSKKVYGVFSNWDDADDGLDGDVNDMNIAQVGTFIIRVNADVTVEAGDLLVSNGDGTAKNKMMTS